MKRPLPYQILFWGWPLLMWVIVRWMLGYNGLYGQDSHEYLRFSNVLLGALQGENGLESFYWPWGYPLAGALLGWLPGGAALALQLLSTLSLVGLLFYSRKLLLLFDPHQEESATLLVLLTIGCAPILLVFGLNVMSDLPAAFLCMASAFYLVKSLRQASTTTYLKAGFFLLLTLNTRFPAAILLFLPALLALIHGLRKVHWGGIIVGTGTLVLFLLVQSLTRPEHAFDILGNSFFQDWSFAHLFQNSFNTADGQISYTLPNILFNTYPLFYPTFFFGSLLLLFWGFWKKANFVASWPIWLSALIFLLFSSGIPFQNQRVLLIVFPFLLPLLLPGFNHLMNALSPLQTKGLIFLTVGLQLFLAGFFFRSFYHSQQTQKAIAASLQQYPQKTIYTTGIEMAFPVYGVQNEVISIWENHHEELKANSLFLYNPIAFGEQWKDKNPGKTWTALQENGTLESIASYPGGWTLFRWNPKNQGR